MLALLVLLLFAIAPFLVPEYRGEPWAWGLSAICILALIGLAWGKWRDYQAREAIIELNERDKHR